MLLAVDVGNSNTTLGLFAQDELQCELSVTTQRSWTRDEVAMTMRQALALAGLAFADIDDAVIASVVPPALPPLLDALQRYADVQPLVVGPGVRTGMPIRYDPPQDVGADRIVTAVAAHTRYGRTAGAPPQGIIVVDFGTATTFDVISPTPEYLGGVIAPGIGISAEALFARAAKLPRVEIAIPDRVVGRNTVRAMQSGLSYGYVGLVDGLIGRISAEVDFPVRVIATGGLARTIAGQSTLIELVDDTLVLEGLRLIHALNQSKGA